MEGFEKKAIYPVMKNFWPTFSRIIAHDICQATTHQGPKGILTNIVQMIFKNSLGPERSVETNISKKSCFQDDKNYKGP